MKIATFSKTILRLPTFSYSNLKTILELNNNSWVEEILNNELFMQGIMISSPDFYNEIKNYKPSDDPLKNEKIRLTLLKYLIRSSTRCTPFGLFSGLAILDNTNFSENQKGQILTDKMEHFHRLDSGYSSLIIDKINSTVNIRPHLTYFVNTTLYEKSGKYRYIYYTLQNDNTRKYELIQIKKNKYLKKILHKTQKGTNFINLVSLLVDHGFENEDSVNYINELIDSQILVSELEPSSIGISNEERCLKILKKITTENDNSDIRPYFSLLDSCNKEISHINLKSPISSYNDLKSLHESLREKLNNKDTKTLNSDLYFKTNNTLSLKQKKLLNDGISVFSTLTNLNKSESKTRLDLFIEEFVSKYEYESVRLVDVLDVESGIGYDLTLKNSGIEDDLLLNDFPRNRIENSKSIPWSIFDSFIIRKIESCNINFSNSLEINMDELKKLTNSEDVNSEILSSTGCVRFSLFKNENNDDIISIDSISKSSPNKVIGRFSTGNNEILDLMNEISLFENLSFDHDTIIAEIDHLPFSSFGNTLRRCNTRKYIISYSGGVDHDNNDLISLSDLYIRYDNRKLVLFSKKLKKRIIPFFSNSFNEDMPNILPVFKFLFDLHYQYENKQNGYININKYLDFFKHIPRIRFRNIILSKQTWIVTKKDFIKDNYSIQQIFDNFKKNCNFINLPEQFTIVNGDMEMLINTNNHDTIRIFISELKKNNSLILKEFLISTLDSVVLNSKNNNLQFNNEFFVPFKFENRKKDIIILNKRKERRITRSFTIGSKWIYFKIYLSNKSADKLLIEIHEKLNALVKNKTIKKYFFIKYVDPNHHIRLRILLYDKHFFDSVFKDINSEFNRFIFKKEIDYVILDTYKRELERYDYNKIVIFEKIFHYDSNMVMNLLTKINQGRNVPKWFYCLIVIDIYCSSMGQSNEEKLIFSEQLKEAFSAEFKSSSQTTKFINEKYSLYKKDLLLFFEDYENDTLEFDFKTFKDEVHSKMIKFGVLTLEKKNKYLQNIIHMHIIRLLGVNNNRLYEFLIYSFFVKIIKANHFKSLYAK